MKSNEKKSEERDPLLLRIVDVVEFVFGLFTTDLFYVALGIVLLILFVAFMAGLLVEFLVVAALLCVLSGLAWACAADV